MLKKNSVIKTLVYRLRGILTTEELVRRGMKVGKNFFRGHEVLLDNACCWMLEIGNQVTLSDHVKIYCHDASTKIHMGYTKVGAVKLGDRVYVGAGTLILPNVTIGNDVIIGAGSVVTHDVPNGMVVAGNPARVLCSLEEYLRKERERQNRVHTWNQEETSELIHNEEKQKEAKELIRQDGISFIY